MNLLDFENEFRAKITFEGDNETDANLISIKRCQFDNSGNDIEVQEEYTLSRESLHDIVIGLEAMAKKIRDHLGDIF